MNSVDHRHKKLNCIKIFEKEQIGLQKFAWGQDSNTNFTSKTLSCASIDHHMPANKNYVIIFTQIKLQLQKG